MDFNDRKFKFLFYQVSHNEVIIRSPKNDLDYGILPIMIY